MLNNPLQRLLHLMQFADSALPVGGFAFSNTLESAIDVGIVHNEPSLEEFVHSLLRQTATTDGIAALNTHRATLNNDYGSIIRYDEALHARKANAELRLMSQRMGRKMAELGATITDHKLLERLHADIVAVHTAGSYAVVQGVVFAICNIGRQELFATICYGTATMTLNAALRCMRITHHQTQRILFRLAQHVGRLYDDISSLDIEHMHSFAPMVDILSAMHEKGARRLFMN